MSELSNTASTGALHDDSVAIAFQKAVATPGKNRKTDLRVKKVELVVRCQELARFLRGFNELNWAGWIEDNIVELRHDSRVGIAHLLEGYNGIGAISDLYLCPEAGHRLTVRDEAAINEQLLLMLAKVNQLALEINRRDVRGGKGS
ncbi:MAG: hypothetical protein HKN70_12590 [Gammaproteobacteria bacterium]|nr:hypothetical protein [Gammaproteobacteria bacterium]